MIFMTLPLGWSTSWTWFWMQVFNRIFYHQFIKLHISISSSSMVFVRDSFRKLTLDNLKFLKQEWSYKIRLSWSCFCSKRKMALKHQEVFSKYSGPKLRERNESISLGCTCSLVFDQKTRHEDRLSVRMCLRIHQAQRQGLKPCLKWKCLNASLKWKENIIITSLVLGILVLF